MTGKASASAGASLASVEDDKAPSRRDCLAAMTAAGLVTTGLIGAVGALPGIAVARDAETGGDPSLDAVARTRGLRYGSAIGGAVRGSFSDPKVRALLAAQGGVLVPENELKWQAVQRTPGAYSFDQADAILAFAERNGLEMRGHNLLWHNAKWLPAWVNAQDFGPRSVKPAETLLVEHIFTVMDRYKAHIHSWDVVNETIDNTTGAMRQTVFTRALGDRVIDIAYHAARETAPDAQLVYNDYMSWEAGNEAHRTGVLRLLERLKKDGVPVDALGLQSHIGTGDFSAGSGAAQPAAWRAFLDEVTGMGYRLLITELDVNDKGLPAAVPVRDQAVADYARRYLDLTLSYPQLTHVLTWGWSTSTRGCRPSRRDAIMSKSGPCPTTTSTAPRRCAKPWPRRSPPPRCGDDLASAGSASTAGLSKRTPRSMVATTRTTFRRTS